MGNFNAVRPHVYVTGAIIFAANHNANEVEIYTEHNNSIHETTGHGHTGATGDGPKLTSSGINLTGAFAWTGAHSFSGSSTGTSVTSTSVNAASITIRNTDTTVNNFQGIDFKNDTGAIVGRIACVNIVHTAASEDTYFDFIEISAGTLASRFSLSATSASFNCTTAFAIPALCKLYVDGGGDTYIHEDAGNSVRLVAGGVDTFRWTATRVETSSSVDFAVQAAKNLYLDGGGDTYIYEVAANDIRFVAGGTASLDISSTAISGGSGINFSVSTNVFFVDASNNRTYQGNNVSTTINSTNFSRQLVSSGTAFDGKISTSAGNAGIIDWVWHNSASPAANDIIYQLGFYGNSSTGTLRELGHFDLIYDDPTNGSEDSSYKFRGMVNGSLQNLLLLGVGGVSTIRSTLKPEAGSTYDLGDAALDWLDIFSQNALTVTSDRRLKDNIQVTDLGTDFIKSLNPVKYTWKDEKETHYGFIAQDVESVLNGKEFGGLVYDKDTDKYMMRYDELMSPLVKTVQELISKVEVLENRA